jgi:cyanophycin synthetase
MLLKIGFPPKFIPGYILGLKQASLSYHLKIKKNADFSLEKIDLIIQGFFKDFNPNQIFKENPTSIIHRFIWLVIQIQRLHEIPVSEVYFLEEKIDRQEYLYTLVLPVIEINSANAAFDWAIQLFEQISLHSSLTITDILQDKKFKELVVRFNQISQGSQNYFHILDAALNLNIPIINCNPELLSLGVGKKNRKMLSTITENTSPIGIKLAQDKHKTSNLLRSLGFPATINFPIENINQCLSLIEKIGYPVVIKPRNLDRGEGVFANITNASTLISCFEKTLKFSKHILLEKHVRGIGHRLTVLNNKVIKVTRKMPLGLYGDGKSTISKLINLANQSRIGKTQLIYQADELIVLDEEAIGLLDQNNLQPDSIVAENQFIELKRKNNSAAGGTTEVLNIDEVHPDNITLAVNVTKLFSLDIAGIDLIIHDIKESWLKTEAAICDINSQPQTDPKTIKLILTDFFIEQGRIPMHLIITENQRIKLYEKEIHIIAKKLNCNGISSQFGLYINSNLISKKMPSAFDASRAIIQYDDVEACISLMSADEIFKYGLPYDQYESIIIDVEAKKGDLIDNIKKLISPHAKKITKK